MRSHADGRRSLRSLIYVAAALMAVCLGPQARLARADLMINLTNGGGAAPGTTQGTGTLGYVMQHAAQVWELAYNGSGFSHSVDIVYRWEGLGGGTLGSHSLTGQGGSPNRETSALIRFDNDGSSLFFLDGTLNGSDPLNSGNEEYLTYSETAADFGGVNNSINNRRYFAGANGDALGAFDLFTIALHEIGHALGLSSANNSYQSEAWPDNEIDVTSILPAYDGAIIPTNNGATPETGSSSNAHLSSSDPRTQFALMFPNAFTSERVLPSEIDILANAQLSQFSNPNFNLTAVPEPSSLALCVLSLAALTRRSRAIQRA